MEEAAFQKELSKYKVIRTPDYCKSRIKSRTVKPTSQSSAANTKETVQSTIINSNESNFWELFSAANSSILTTVESIKLIEALKLEHDTNKGKVSLHDLEAIAATLGK